ncbi:unnamed protein product [Owenia fusiformis]|uniref:Uncharacterized protein n=1 Tax=Owenia fusiformis TaxID=6347 RepID=A0A8J1UDT1_OWEFU|nr:unnamed protein product [Owenia fusiformis]
MGNTKSKVKHPSVLHEAVSNGHFGTVKHLLAHKLPVDVKDEQGTVPLHIASELGHYAIMRLLLEEWANVNVQDDSKHSALHLAAHNGHIECMKLLIAHRANLNLRDTWDRTPLHKAIINNQIKAAKYLLTFKQCSVNIPDEIKRMVLHTAASYGQCDLVAEIIAHGGIIDWQDIKGRTALYLAVLVDHIEVVKLLIDSGANVELSNTSNVSPLILAAQKGFLECVRLLLDAGAKTRHSPEFAYPLNSAMLRACSKKDTNKCLAYMEICRLIIQSDGEPPPNQTFYVAYRWVQQEQENEVVLHEMLDVIHLMFLAGMTTDFTTLTMDSRHDNLINEWRAKYLARCLSLKDVSRRALRSHLQGIYPNLIYAVGRLNLPRRIKEMILLKD